jgi:predicted Zn-dependent peptidase
MEKVILSNGIKVLYEYRGGNISSFCIGFNAGALEEKDFNPGTAHALEHMLFKGTQSRNEFEINMLCDEIFGFNNAMTNYPYAIYYGTVNSEEFERGFELYSDILLRPLFSEEGFREEINVILEELKEWKEDIAQRCEDIMLENAFLRRRIKELIIGDEGSVTCISLDNLRDFYNRYYVPGNCVISVVSSLDKNSVMPIIEKYMAGWQKEFKGIEKTEYEKNKPGIHLNEVAGCSGGKIAYCFTMDFLSEDEVEIFNLFNAAFGEGVSSLLYDEIRTRHGLAYEIGSSIKNERGIKLFTIYMGTAKDKIDTSIRLIDSVLEKAVEQHCFSEADIEKFSKRLRLKRELAVEKSIELCKKLTTYELMYGTSERLYEEMKFNHNIDKESIIRVAKKVLKNPTIQIIT